MKEIIKKIYEKAAPVLEAIFGTLVLLGTICSAYFAIWLAM